jgi:4-amino-4-deoxy-L-arabinose transferase-like glycosyltransferase
MRATAAVVAALVVAAVIFLTLRLAGGRITAVTAGLLAATVGGSPFIESFTLSGELLASLPAVLSLACFCVYLRDRRLRWLLVAGLLTGIAVLIKQSAFDAALAAVAYLLWQERRRGITPASVLVAAAAAPVVIAAASATKFGAWVYAVVGYRFEGDSIVTGSLAGRAHQLWLSLPPAGKALGLLALLAAVGWRRAPFLARLWLGAAVVGVLGGGNFHTHYYLQLVPPLAVLGSIGLRRLWLAAPRPALAAAAAAAGATLAAALPVAWASPTSQAQTIWPRDPHLVHDETLARYVRLHTQPHQRVLALWADADLYYLADRMPAVPYLWARNVETIPGALQSVRYVLARRRAALVLVVQPPAKLDPSGRTRQLLRRGYRLVGRIGGVAIYRSKIQRKTSAASKPSTAR